LVVRLKASISSSNSITPSSELEELIPIEEIKVGDKVLSWDETSGKKSFKKVTKLFYHEVNLLYNLELVSGEIITTTWNHPFYVVREEADKRSSSLRGGWFEAKDLRAGDKLYSASGKIVELKSITSKEQEESVGVYNFEVEDNHTYFVSKEEVLVHNYDPTGLSEFGRIYAQQSEIENICKKDQSCITRNKRILDDNEKQKQLGEAMGSLLAIGSLTCVAGGCQALAIQMQAQALAIGLDAAGAAYVIEKYLKRVNFDPTKINSITRILQRTPTQISQVWLKNPFLRGQILEKSVGRNLHQNFPVLDRFENGIATSISH
jgi:Pretoxin HINT domain